MKISTIVLLVANVLLVGYSTYLYATFDEDAVMRSTINRAVIDVVAFN